MMFQTPPTIFVKVFKARSAEDAAAQLARHARELARAGYVPLSQSWADVPTSATSVRFLGWLGLLFRDDGRLTVTYSYRPDITGPPTARLRVRSDP